MSTVDIGTLRYSTVSYLYATRKSIDMAPSYQRQGAIWSISKQQLLIDSILNGFDVPKIYFHQFATPRTSPQGDRVLYALVDGKQRLEAVFGFLEGAFALSEDFRLLEDASVGAAGLTYRELSDSYPELVGLLNATSLGVVTIRTDDLEMIEEMFSRLNEAVPLNAAEKRNALGGPCPAAVRRLSEHNFFKKKLPFTNTRYRHYDLSAKFLLWTDHFERSLQRGINPRSIAASDVKKYRLDSFFVNAKESGKGDEVELITQRTDRMLDALSDVFTDNDTMLGSVGMVSIYFLLFTRRLSSEEPLPSRRALMHFEEARRRNRVPDDSGLTPGQYRLLEFDRLAQSPNDGSALTYRLDTLDIYLRAVDDGADPLDLLEPNLEEVVLTEFGDMF